MNENTYTLWQIRSQGGSGGTERDGVTVGSESGYLLRRNGFQATNVSLGRRPSHGVIASVGP